MENTDIEDLCYEENPKLETRRSVSSGKRHLLRHLVSPGPDTSHNQKEKDSI